MIITISGGLQQTSTYSNQTPSTSNESTSYGIAQNISRAESSHASSSSGITCQPEEHPEQTPAAQLEVKHDNQPSTSADDKHASPAVEQLPVKPSLDEWKNLVLEKKWDRVLTIVQNGIDAELANTSISGGRTTLMQAVYAHRIEIVDALLKVSGICIDAIDHDGHTALILASYVDNAKATSMLLHRANINMTNNHGDSALLMAVKKNHMDVINVLMQMPDINPNRADNHGQSPLHWCARRNHQQIISKLLDHPQLTLNAVDESDRSALMVAAIYGNFEAAELLCNDSRTDISLPNQRQKTALTLASERHLPVIDLLQHHANASRNNEPDNAHNCYRRALSRMTNTLGRLLQKRTRQPDWVPLIDIHTDQQATEQIP